MKKLFAFVLTFILALSLILPVFAEDNGSSTQTVIYNGRECVPGQIQVKMKEGTIFEMDFIKEKFSEFDLYSYQTMGCGWVLLELTDRSAEALSDAIEKIASREDVRFVKPTYSEKLKVTYGGEECYGGTIYLKLKESMPEGEKRVTEDYFPELSDFDVYDRYTYLEINLFEDSEEALTEAMELLSKRDDVEYVYPWFVDYESHMKTSENRFGTPYVEYPAGTGYLKAGVIQIDYEYFDPERVFTAEDFPMLDNIESIEAVQRNGMRGTFKVFITLSDKTFEAMERAYLILRDSKDELNYYTVDYVWLESFAIPDDDTGTATDPSTDTDVEPEPEPELTEDNTDTDEKVSENPSTDYRAPQTSDPIIFAVVASAVSACGFMVGKKKIR